MDNEIIQKIYNELLACNKKEDLETLAGSWCIVLLKNKEGCWYKTPFSDWGDMRYIFWNNGDVYKENEYPISFWDYLQSDEKAYNKHIKRVQEFELYKDCITLIRYLKFIKQFLNMQDKETANELIRTVVEVKLKLKRFLTETDFTDTYTLLGVIDTIQYDWCRNDLPELYINKKYHPLLDDIRDSYINDYYDYEEK